MKFSLSTWTDEDIFNLTLLTPDDVNFYELPEAVLEKVALGIEPYFANAALAELHQRNRALAGAIAESILGIWGHLT